MRGSADKVYSFIFLCIFIFCTWLLVSASPWLLIPITQSPYLPLGTLTTWIGMVSLPVSMYCGFRMLRRGQHYVLGILRILLKTSIFLSASWGLISYTLAGNWSYSFGKSSSFSGSDMASNIFWYLNYAIVGLPVAILLSYSIFMLYRWVRPS